MIADKWDDIEHVAVIRRHDDEGVAQIDHLRGGADGLVECLRVGQCPIRVAFVMGVIDASASTCRKYPSDPRRLARLQQLGSL